jgi:hypothetical protein
LALDHTQFIGNIDQKDPLTDLRVVAGKYLAGLTQSGRVSLWSLQTVEKLCNLRLLDSVATMSICGTDLRLFSHRNDIFEIDVSQDLDSCVVYKPNCFSSHFINAFDGTCEEEHVTVLFSQNGSLWIGDRKGHGTEPRLVELDLPMGQGKITDAKLSQTGTMAVSTNRNEVWIFSRRPSQSEEWLFELTGHFDTKVSKKFDYQWGMAAFDSKSEDVWAIFNNSPQMLVWNAVDKKVILSDHKNCPRL